MRFLLILAVLLVGCGGQRGVSSYLRQLAPFQTALTDFQTEMKGIGGRPLAERSQAYQELAERVRAKGAELQKLQPPPAASEVHKDFLELYAVLAEFFDTAAHSGGPDDPPLKAVKERWQTTLARAQAHLDKL